jgi:hypothetical protein
MGDAAALDRQHDRGNRRVVMASSLDLAGVFHGNRTKGPAFKRRHQGRRDTGGYLQFMKTQFMKTMKTLMRALLAAV